MTATVGDISWWSRLREDQRDRIEQLASIIADPECGIHPAAVCTIHGWLNEARQSWHDVNTHDVERCLRIATEKLAEEREWQAQKERPLS
jgi:hypothetical protein